MTFQLTIMARELAAAIAACATVIEPSAKIPILRAARIAVDGGFASFVATNADQTITVRAACSGEGVACIDAASLATKAATLKPGEPVTIVGDGKSVTISQGRAKWKLPVMLDDFPVETAKPLDAPAVKLGKDFIKALAQGFSAIDAGHPMVALQGAHVAGGKVTTTGGKMMRIIEFDGDAPFAIIPAKVVGRVTAMFPDGCDYAADRYAATFSDGFTTLKTKLIDGQFPDVDRALAAFTHTGTLTVDAAEFIATIKRASAISAQSEKDGAFINMELRFRGEEIEAFARNNSTSEEGSDFCRMDRQEGGDVDIGVNGAFLISSVLSLDCDTIEIRHGGKETPIVMRPVGAARENVRYLMPRHFS